MAVLWRHRKTGGVYEIIVADASLQCATAPDFEQMFEDDGWVVYRNVKTGATYLRLDQEFSDGRFEQLPQETAND